MQKLIAHKELFILFLRHRFKFIKYITSMMVRNPIRWANPYRLDIIEYIIGLRNLYLNMMVWCQWFLDSPVIFKSRADTILEAFMQSGIIRWQAFFSYYMQECCCNNQVYNSNLYHDGRYLMYTYTLRISC